MQQEELEELTRKYLQGSASPQERQQLEEWYRLNARTPAEWMAGFADEEKRVKDEMFRHIRASTGIASPKPVRLWPKIAAAASILFVLSAGGYFLLHKPQVSQTAQFIKNDITPGHNQATLTLANGKKIVLTKGLIGQLAVQNQTVINAANNAIIYEAHPSADQFSYNTLSTAKGEQSPYPLVLADGTKVWLNAESSITFPTAFNGKERVVKLTGEAYFEVKHNSNQPFKVQTATQTIEDIGTQFDVNAYSDEPKSTTTLIEGSVKVNNTIIKPGQQTDGLTISDANTGEVIAWKNGIFRFRNDQIQTVMRQLARWYDIRVYYQGTGNHEGFNAKISRNQKISVILSALERTGGVRFKIEGRRVTVIE